MTGLILKDYYILLHLYKKSLLLVALFFGVMSFAMQSDFMLLYLVLMMSFYTLGSITLDVNCHWDRYARTLPVRPSAIVSGKYLVSLLFMLLSAAYAVILGVARRLFLPESDPGFWGSLLVIIAVSLIVAALMIPASFKWGVDKARNFLMIFFLGFFFLIMLFENQPIVVDSLDFLSAHITSWLPWLLGAAALIYVASYRFCCRLYSRQEY